MCFIRSVSVGGSSSINALILCSCQTVFHCIIVMQYLWNCLMGLYIWTLWLFLFFSKQSCFPLFSADRGGLYSIPERPRGRTIECCSRTFLPCSVYFRFCFHILCLSPCRFASWDRFWAEKVPFLSSFFRSLEATGLKGQITSWVTHWTTSSCSLCLQPHEPSWNVTQQLQSTGNTS